MNLDDLINKNYEYLSDTDSNIAKYVLANKDKIGKMGINQLAINSLASKSSVLRFTQKLGFSGYSEFKNFVKWEDAIPDDTLEPNELLDQIIFDVKKTLEYLNKVDLEPIYEVIEESDNIYVISTGIAQGNQAAELQRLFLLIGKPVQFIPGMVHANEYRRVIEKLTSEDLIILFSLSGENPTLQGLLDIPAVKGAKIISVTNFKSNWLSGNADYNLYASSTMNPNPRNWWVRSASSFFIVVEALAFGYIGYKNKKR
ncbi:MurR/RpiR family transcriptional regulator [Bacillus sp. FJAT-27251]|uniref:MurR/RpiR family transcriptional regulator n=1 Tax=Bacillus sp. FJAT-27251 TaxID=1684142 RepID=UPI0006A7E48A|nr:MurR/RpiR family transcriptional regulator [Bacillus sp. FJAT-27251]